MKFKVGDRVIVNKSGRQYPRTKPGSYGVISEILNEWQVWVLFDYIQNYNENKIVDGRRIAGQAEIYCAHLDFDEDYLLDKKLEEL